MDKEDACRVMVRKPETKRPPCRPRRRWEDNIKLHRKGIFCNGVDRIILASNGGGFKMRKRL
jgi:hypothetical protein